MTMLLSVFRHYFSFHAIHNIFLNIKLQGRYFNSDLYFSCFYKLVSIECCTQYFLSWLLPQMLKALLPCHDFNLQQGIFYDCLIFILTHCFRRQHKCNHFDVTCRTFKRDIDVLQEWVNAMNVLVAKRRFRNPSVIILLAKQ